MISDLRKRQIQYYDNYIYLYVTEMHFFQSIAKPVSMRYVYAKKFSNSPLLKLPLHYDVCTIHINNGSESLKQKHFGQIK